MGHNRQQAILESVEGREIEKEAEDTLPYVLLSCFERLPHDLIDFDVQLKTTAVGVGQELTDLFVNLATLALAEVHERIPVDR